MAWALRGASHFPPLAGTQGSGPEAESRPEKGEGGTGTPSLPLRGDPGSARVRARATLAPPIVVQQVELVSRGATCCKGREAPCGGGWGGESESHPVRPGRPRVAEPGLRCSNLIPFYTSGRGPLGYVALQAQLEASSHRIPSSAEGKFVSCSPPNPHVLKYPGPPPHLGLRESQSRCPSYGDSVSPLQERVG